MIKHLLTAGLLGAAPLALYAADNVNLMPWVNGTEWPSTSVEKNANGSYTVYVTQDWAGAGIDFAGDHPDFSLDGFTGIHIDVTADNAGQKMVYVNYDDPDYDEHGNQGQTGTYDFAPGKSVRKIVFKFERAGTYIMRAFTLLAPNNSTPVQLASGDWKLNDTWEGGFYHIDASNFADITVGENLIITYSTWGGDAQAQIYAPKTEGRVNANSASESCHLYATETNNGIYADLPGGDNLTLDIKLTEDMVKYLQLYGLCFEGHNVTFSKVERLTGNPTIDVEDMPEPSLDPVSPNEGLGGIPMGVAPKNGIPSLFDNDPSSSYNANRADRAWAGLDLGEPYVITKVKWMAADNEAADVNLGVFEGANNEDFSDALPLYIIRSTKGAGEWNEADITHSRGFRYVRYVGPRPLTGSDNFGENSTLRGSHAKMAELRFFGQKGIGDDSNLYRFSSLPTVVINTVGMEEPWDRFADPDKEMDLTATLSVIGSDGQLVTAPGIARERGNHSRYFPKRPLRMKFDDKTKPLSEAKAKRKKWELLNNYGDKTLMRNLLAFDIAKKLGMDFVPFCTPVDVVLNGEYRGCYQLADNKEIDSKRLDITEMDKKEDWSDPEVLSGGYFLEVDAYAFQEPAGTWFNSTNGYGIPVTMKSPEDKDNPTYAGMPLKYISDHFNDLTGRVAAGKYEGDGNYHEIFDVESFLQLLMTNEVGGNKDVMWSFNMYKDRNDPHIYSGPAWDFDVAFDNSQWLPQQAYDEKDGKNYLYQITNSVADSDRDALNQDRGSAFRDFTNKIMDDPRTKEELYHLWCAARDNGLSAEYLCGQADYYQSLMGDAINLNFERWPIMDKDIHDDFNGYASYDQALDHVKEFIRKTFDHFDRLLGYTDQVKGQHMDELAVTVDDNTGSFNLSVPYGKLMVKDEPVAVSGEDTPARAAAAGKFINASHGWSLDKSNLDSAHLITYYAKHAGRETTPESVLISADGTVSAIETVADDNADAPREYFSLTGVKVSPATATPGIYICRQGDKVTKVVLR